MKKSAALLYALVVACVSLSAYAATSVAQNAPIAQNAQNATNAPVDRTDPIDPTAPGAATPERFADPPVEVRPWAYYWNLKGNTSSELAIRDVDNMAAIGLGGLLVFDSRRYWDDYASTTHVPVPLEIKREFMSKEWREVMTDLVKEASKFGMNVSFNISDSGGQLRGPWDMKELGPYELIWTEGNIDGPKKISIDCAAPEDSQYFYDVATVAVRISSAPAQNREDVVLNAAWNKVALEIGANAPKYDRVVDLTSNVNAGKLEWEVPRGHWKIIRFGATRIGEPGCVDILNAKATEDYFAKTPGALLDDVGELAGKTLTHFYNVSWEGVHPNWSADFERFFEERRGYAMRKYMPILRGLAPDDDLDPNRFLADYMRTISDSFRQNCYETIGRLCHERNVRWHSEDGGPWNRKSPLFQEADMLSFWGQNDFPQGEFWIGRLAQTNAPYAAMAAHIYGRRDVSLEAFTHMNKHWSVYPALLKPYADESFLAGANLMIWHTYTASPEELGKPGFEYFAGTHLNSNVTWQPYVRPFMDYMARCQLLLRQGRFVSDVCVFTSDKNYVQWGLAEKWNEKSELTIPKGYRYDLIDAASLVERLEYRDGVLALPGGAQYRLLVVDLLNDQISLEAARKILALAFDGAPILLGATEPKRSNSALNWRYADSEIQSIGRELWRGIDRENVYRNSTVEEALNSLGVRPDYDDPSPMRFAHRVDDEIGAEYYFVSTSDETIDEAPKAVFRVYDKIPSLWDPKSGKVFRLQYETLEDGRIAVEGIPRSSFVVFTKEPLANLPMRATTQEPVATILPESTFEIRFDPKYGAPESATWDKLAYWNENDVPEIKYYSGVATYVFNVKLDAETAKRALKLQLGTVRDIARVRFNGVDCGIAWTTPFDVDLGTNGVEGDNRLEIEVANCWRNRLVGDAGLDQKDRYTQTNVVLQKTNDPPMPAYRGYTAEDDLEPSGLIGPVVVTAR